MTIYSENGVPVLFRGPGQKIGLSEDGQTGGEDLLLGHSVAMHCRSLSVAPDEAGVVFLSIGASTLDEALKECVGAFDLAHLHPKDESSDHLYPPEWVASTHERLGELLADYYSCQLRPLSEVL